MARFTQRHWRLPTASSLAAALVLTPAMSRRAWRADDQPLEGAGRIPARLRGTTAGHWRSRRSGARAAHASL